jgi:hypothetical protein
MTWTTTYELDRLPFPSLVDLLNPVWYFSDDERNMNWGWWEWFKRNPCANFTAKIIGVSCFKRRWVSTMYGANFPEKGWGFAWCIGPWWLLPRPWICYRGAALELGIGWKSHGGFGINRRTTKAPNATEYPT